MKQRFLLSLLLLSPFLAQAYAGGGSLSRGQGFLLAFLLLAPFVVPPVLMLWAYLRPRKQGLQLMQGLVMVGFAWGWTNLQQDRSVRSMEGVCYYLNTLVPLALLLNGLTQARQVARWQTRLCWTGVAITGGSFLVWNLLPSLRGLVGEQDTVPGAILSLVVALASWVGVLHLLRREPALSAALWQGPWWRTPAVVSGVGATYMLVNLLGDDLYWSFIGSFMLYVAVISLLAGIISLRLVSPLAPAPETELENPALTEW